MSDFEKAIQVLLDHEGKFSNNPNDPGGATYYGISLRFLKIMGKFGDFDGDGDVDIDDIRLLDVDKASSIYKKEWWDNFNYGLINDDRIATKLLDCSVNMGAMSAHKLIQRAVNLLPAHEGNDKKYIKVDGIFGNNTIHSINAADPERLMIVFKGVLSSYYIGLAENNPKYETFIVGWLNKKVND